MHAKHLAVALSVGALFAATTGYAFESLEVLPSGAQSSQYKYLRSGSGTSSIAKAVSPAEWTIKPGSLKDQLVGWTRAGGYQLVWNATKDFSVDASASFSGDLITAVSAVVETLHSTGSLIKVEIYEGNKVIVVKEG